MEYKMKKATALSVLIIIAMVIFMAFSFSSDRQDNGPKGGILVHVVGCDDCTNLYVCVGGILVYEPKDCDFYVDCYQMGSVIQTICVVCGDKQGQVTVDCRKVTEVYIYVEPNGNDCPCGTKKKK